MQTIQAKLPYRIPFVGGMTDYPEFYRKHRAASLCCTIDKYISVVIDRNRHGGLTIESHADLEWGMGLGSSGTFHSALITALAKLKRKRLSAFAVAKLAYDLETGIDAFGTGRQDSVACLFNGISMISYLPNDSVKVKRITLSSEVSKMLSSRLLLFDTGIRRSAGRSIKDVLSRKNEALLKEIAKLPKQLILAWSRGNIDFVRYALDLQEEYRGQLSPTCKSRRTDELLRIARNCGAGARLTGAGLGCLLCYCPEEMQQELRNKINIPEIKFSILW